MEIGGIYFKVAVILCIEIQEFKTHDSNYKIKKITLDDARQNQEVIRLSNSELIRAIQRIRGIDFNQSYLDELLQRRRKGNIHYH